MTATPNHANPAPEDERDEPEGGAALEHGAAVVAVPTLGVADAGRPHRADDDLLE